jgi:DNA-binding beta-propeller fold protein YncE
MMLALRWIAVAGALVLLVSACGGSTAGAPAPSPTGKGKSQLFVFTDKPPAVSVVDPQTGKVLNQAAIDGFSDWTWTWNDDNNYSDGKNLWLGLRNPNTDDIVIIVFSLDRLQITNQIQLGKDKLSLYIGKATKKGVVDVGKMASGEVVAIDAKTAKILNRWSVPVNGDVVCDADVGTTADGVQRFYYPTRKGDTVVSIDPETGAVNKVAEAPKGANPFMLTAAPNGTVWVQESGSNTNAVLDGASLSLIKRIPVAKGPIVATFSPDGKLGYIGHTAEPVVVVIDTRTLDVVHRVEAGTFPSKLAVDPNGKAVYAMLTQEKSVAVIDTTSWTVGSRIPLTAAPASLYLRQGT